MHTKSKSELARAGGEARPETSPASLPARPKRTLLFLIGIVVFWGLIYIPGLASPPMMDDADSEHAQIPVEMLQRHDYVTMYVNGVRYLEKAPLPYWIMAGIYSVAGVSEFSVRLELSLFALLTFLAVFLLAREIAGEEAGFYAALALATAIGPYIYTRFIIPDIMVCFWLTVTVYLFWRSLEEPRPSRLLCWSIGVVTALDVLTKGLIGLAFPIGIIGGYLLITRNWRHLLKMRLVSTTLVFLAVGAPWHVLATLRNPPMGEAKGFFWFYFINDQILRYLNLRVPRDYDKVPLLLFWGLLLVWTFPWSFAVVKSLKQVPLRVRDWGGQLDKPSRGALLMAVWAAFVLVFFSFSTRQEYYVLPALPALAVLCGMWLKREADSAPDSALRRSALRGATALLVLGVIGSTAAGWFAAVAPAVQVDADFGEVLRRVDSMYKLSMGHLFDLTLQAMGFFRWPLILTAISFFVGTVLHWIFRRRGASMKANLTLASMMVVLLYAVHLALGTFNPVLGSKPLALAIERYYKPGDTIVVNGQYSRASSILFYTGVQMHMLNGVTNDLWFGSLYPDCPKVFEDDASFARLWRGPGRVFFFIPSDRNTDPLQKLGAPYYLVAKAGEKSVYTNRPLTGAASN
ncbi:MAG TPA: glycosyltransferase family 39 protein [Candidatus Binatus sp.]|nr:glycosyltransferase family 39 protein [Candidatus Binatus sp.]